MGRLEGGGDGGKRREPEPILICVQCGDEYEESKNAGNLDLSAASFCHFEAAVQLHTCMCNCIPFAGLLQGACRGSSKKRRKFVWLGGTMQSSFSELSYLAFSQNSLSNSPRFASLAYSYFVVYIRHHNYKNDR